MARLYIAMDHISDLACALIVVLFFMLIRMATLLLIFLNEKFSELMDDSSIPATTHISELKKWKRQHFLVIQLAEKLSSSFGMILFLQFTWFCIRLFILTYRTFLWPREIIFDMYKLHSYRHWLEVFNEGHQFFITVYAAFDLQKEVPYTILKSTHLKVTNKHIRLKIVTGNSGEGQCHTTNDCVIIRKK